VGDLTHKQAAEFVKIANEDETRVVTVVNVAGQNRLATDSNISSVNVPLGKDPIPDCYFEVTQAGSAGDTIRVQIAGTSVDPTTPDRDLPAVDVTYTLIVADEGDEHALAHKVAQALEADVNFQNAFLEADVISGNQRPIVHISSTEFSMNGEFHERPNFGDVTVSVTGSTTVLIDDANRVLVSRPKEVSLGRDPDNPHRLGVQAISGTVRVRAEAVDQLFEEEAKEVGGSNTDLTIDGSGTPVVFEITANPAGGFNKVVEVLKLYGEDGNIKVGESNFLGNNAPLSSGILIEITQNESTTQFRNIQTTNDFLARFSSSPSNSEIIGQSGGDYIVSTFDLVSRNTQLTLENGTTDKITVTIRDDLTAVNNLFFVAEGFLEED